MQHFVARPLGPPPSPCSLRRPVSTFVVGDTFISLFYRRSPSNSPAESSLDAHDLAIPLPHPSQDRNSVQTNAVSRYLRVLLLSPIDFTPHQHSATLVRLQHFAALTGGVDVIIVLLLNLQKDRKVNASVLPPAMPLDVDDGLSGELPSGIRAYMQLQTDVITHHETSGLPILPLYSVDGLAQLLRSHVDGRTSRMPLTKAPDPQAAARRCVTALLPYVTTTPPLRQHTVFLLTDLFPSLKGLAAAAVTEEGRGVIADALEEGNAEGADREVDGVVEFWREEWVAE